MTPLPSRAGLACVLAGTLATIAAAPAQAAVESTRSAKKFATAIAEDAGEIIGAKWVKIPKRGRPAAIAKTDGRLAAFPREGGTFGVLSTGDATAADDPNDSEELSSSNRGPAYRGAYDVVVFRIDFRVRRDQRCVSFDFKFFSEEFDEFVDSPFNDAFVAELDRSTWKTGGNRESRIRAPLSFARARSDRFISINQTGDFAVTEKRARDTTYDAGTRTLRASSRVSPGRHSVFISIFDQGDRLYDSAVFIDRFRVDDRKPCTSGTAAV